MFFVGSETLPVIPCRSTGTLHYTTHPHPFGIFRELDYRLATEYSQRSSLVPCKHQNNRTRTKRSVQYIRQLKQSGTSVAVANKPSKLPEGYRIHQRKPIALGKIKSIIIVLSDFYHTQRTGSRLFVISICCHASENIARPSGIYKNITAVFTLAIPILWSFGRDSSPQTEHDGEENRVHSMYMWEPTTRRTTHELTQL